MKRKKKEENKYELGWNVRLYDQHINWGITCIECYYESLTSGFLSNINNW